MKRPQKNQEQVSIAGYIIIQENHFNKDNFNPCHYDYTQINARENQKIYSLSDFICKRYPKSGEITSWWLPPETKNPKVVQKFLEEMEHTKKKIQDELKLEDNKFQDLIKTIDKLYETEKLALSDIFFDLEALISVKKQFLNQVPDLKILAVGLTSSNQMDYWKKKGLEYQSHYGTTQNNHTSAQKRPEDWIDKELKKQITPDKNWQFCGYSVSVFGVYSGFYSFFESHLYEGFNIPLNDYFLMDDLDLAIEIAQYASSSEEYINFANSTLWQAWAVYEVKA